MCFPDDVRNANCSCNNKKSAVIKCSYCHPKHCNVLLQNIIVIKNCNVRRYILY